jgi:hypothetical protein
MKVITSGDGGVDWTGSFTVGPSPAHWPGVFNLNANQFVALYSEDSGGPVGQVWNLR